MTLPAVLGAQEPAQPPRERVSFIYLAPERLGVLVPLNERWMVRADVSGNAFHTDEPRDFALYHVGASAIRRRTVDARGWSYLVARYSLLNASGSPFEEPYYEHGISLGLGGHAWVIDWLGVFGESGPYLTYHDDRPPGGGARVIMQGGLATRIGVSLRRPARAAANPAVAGAEQQPQREAPSWVFGGYGALNGGGVLVPLSDRWMLRPDFGANFLLFRPSGDTDLLATGGLSLLRRSAPSDLGWVYSGLRYSVLYDQRHSSEPDVLHVVGFSLGAHVRLTPRLAAFGEAGPFVRFYDARYSYGTFDARNVGFAHAVGLTYRWGTTAPGSASR